MSATPEDVLESMKSTLGAAKLKVGDKEITRASLSEQIKAHQHLQAQDVLAARTRPVIATMDLSGAV